MESTRNVRRRTMSLNSGESSPGAARAPQDRLQAAPAQHQPPVARHGVAPAPQMPAPAPRLRAMASGAVPPGLDRCRRQLYAALRDNHFNLFDELLSDAKIHGTQDALVGAGGGEALRVAVSHDRYEESLELWKRMAPSQRSASLRHADGALWAVLPNASVRLVNWVLDRAGFTAEARESSARPHAAHLVRAMTAAMRQGKPDVLHALWDRATWGEWHQAAVEGFRVAYAQDDAATVEQVLSLSLGDPTLRTRKALIRQLEREDGPLVRAVSAGKTRMLATLRPFLDDHERAWLRSLALADAHPAARGAVFASL